MTFSPRFTAVPANEGLTSTTGKVTLGLEEAKMTKVSTARARDQFSEIIARAANKKEATILTRGGKGVAAVVPMDLLAYVEELEDQLDLREAKRALAESSKKGEKSIPWEKARKMLRG